MSVFNTGHGYFLQKGQFSLQGAPHVYPVVWHSSRLWNSLVTHFHTSGLERTDSPEGGRRPKIYASVSLFFISCQMQLGLSWNKFPQTNSPPDHQLRRTNEELIVKSLGQTTQSSWCQVSVTRGWSHPLLTPHPWLLKRYFSGFTHETCFLSPLQNSTQRGLIKSLSKWKIFTFCAYSKKCDPSKMSCQVLSFPRTVSTHSRLPLDLESDESKLEASEGPTDVFKGDAIARTEDTTCRVRLPGF